MFNMFGDLYKIYMDPLAVIDRLEIAKEITGDEGSCKKLPGAARCVPM